LNRSFHLALLGPGPNRASTSTGARYVPGAIRRIWQQKEKCEADHWGKFTNQSAKPRNNQKDIIRAVKQMLVTSCRALDVDGKAGDLAQSNAKRYSDHHGL